MPPPQDGPNQLWVAQANDTASLQRLNISAATSTSAGAGGSSGGGAGGMRGAAEVAEWSRGPAGQQQLALYQARVMRLLQGGH